MSWIIALDGSKGAGKSTTVAEFIMSHPDVVELSLDGVRRGLGIEGTSFEKNIVAFAEVEKLIDNALKHHKNVILDCGLYDSRLNTLRSLAETYGAELHFVFLNAPYDELVRRVKARDNQKGKVFNQPRFDEVYKVVIDKDLSVFTVVDTAQLSTKDVVAILNNLLKG